MTKARKNKKVNKISIKPLMGYVLVEPSEAESTTASGIILPESAQEKPAQGTVVACGDDMVLENGKVVKCPVKNGDKVVYKKWGGDEIKVEGKELKLVKFDDLMAILE
ncbi:co-chaperone GroES [Candidatus Daviesbacteria bacterium]|nr:co-chaperone GroES [Candidatus Daviesbacteria bacterium]MBI4035344.1 co-chaperone GroES [Candidatus Daviesbacteria bacterium]